MKKVVVHGVDQYGNPRTMLLPQDQATRVIGGYVQVEDFVPMNLDQTRRGVQEIFRNPFGTNDRRR